MTTTLGLDIGYSAIKLAVTNEDGAMETMHLPAGVGRPHQLPDRTLTGGAAASDAIHVTLDGEPWVAAIEAARLTGYVRALHSDYTTTPEYRALVYAALAATGADTIHTLTTGLPVSQFQDKANRERLARLLEGAHQVTAQQRVTVEKVIIVPQPAGGFMDAEAMDPTLAEGRVLVLDPGYYSMDWIVLMNSQIQWAYSGTSQRATSAILEAAAGDIAAEYGRAPTADELEAALRNGQDTIKIFRKAVPYRTFVDAAARTILHALQHEIMAPMRHMAGGSNAVDAVVLVGGAAAIYEPVVRSVFPHAELVLPENPVLANARGFFHLGAPAGEPADAVA